MAVLDIVPEPSSQPATAQSPRVASVDVVPVLNDDEKLCAFAI